MKQLCLLLIWTCMGCSSMLYQPIQNQIYHPTQMGMDKPTEIFFPSTDGTSLHAWYFKSGRKTPQGLILFFHGNGENISTHFAALAWILPYGYDYMIFDYRGYGKSEGKPSPEGTVQDGIAAIRYASKLANQVPLTILGQSLGGAIALRSLIELKKEIPIQLVVIDSSFLSYRSAGSHVLSHSWLTWLFQPLAYVLLSDEWAPRDQVSQLAPTPLIVMHGNQDQLIDYELGLEVYEKANQPKELWTIEGGRHIDSFWRHNAIYRIKFLEALKASLQQQQTQSR